MADEATHVQKLGSLADFKAPWETDAGEVDIDKTKLKQYLYNGALDKAKAQDRAEVAEGKVEAAETAKTEADKARKTAEKKLADSDATGEIAELTEKLATASSRADKAEGDLIKLKVGDEKGLSAAQSLRLQGATEEEVAADADAIVELFGLKKPEDNSDEDDDEDDEDEEVNPLRQTPRLVNPTNGGGSEKIETEVDFEAAVAAFDKHNL